MRQVLHHLHVNAPTRGLVHITTPVRAFVREQGIRTGLLTAFCRHASAPLLIQENADPSVHRDIERDFDELAPEDPQRYEHDTEGRDDMPAQLRAALTQTQTQLTIPVEHGEPVLDT